MFITGFDVDDYLHHCFTMFCSHVTYSLHLTGCLKARPSAAYPRVSLGLVDVELLLSSGYERSLLKRGCMHAALISHASPLPSLIGGANAHGSELHGGHGHGFGANKLVVLFEIRVVR